MYSLTGRQIRLSVRNLVEFVLRSGSIDNRFGSGAGKEAMLLGGRLHRKIQSAMGDSYRAEVPLKITVPLGTGELLLEGRADGILTLPDEIVIDEIKSVSIDLDRLDGPVEVHLAQAVCYAYIYAVQQELDRLSVQVTYIHSESEEIRRFKKEYTSEELTDAFFSLINAYRKWSDFVIAHREERNASLQGMQFPYPYRKGQRNLVAAAYRAMLGHELLMMQAPTGIGKTLSVLFPAVIAVGQEKAEKVFYLTAKTVTRTAAMEAIRILRGKGAKLLAVTITARDKLCLLPERNCNPDACPYADGHFDRVNEAVYALITGEEEITRETLTACAAQYRVCPFELCLDVTIWADIIICDYNYLFDPAVRLQRFFADGEQGAYLFLADEAHNLADRAREMYSAEVDKESFLEAKKLYQGFPRLTRLLEGCSRKLLPLKREGGAWRELPEGEGLAAFTLQLQELCEALEGLPESHPDWTGSRETAEFYSTVRTFLSVWEKLDGHYRVYTELTKDERFRVHLFCVDPSEELLKCCRLGYSTILFSATFLPISYYRELLFGSSSEVLLAGVLSPFDSERRFLGICSDISARYSRRTDETYRKYAGCITRVINGKPGNYLVFFPSYSFMEKVAQFCSFDDGIGLLMQDANMSEPERERFLEAFSTDGSASVGFCVMGGIFSEGIDLKGSALIGVLVIGTGLAAINPRQELLRKYYADCGRDGFAWSYLYPGMNRVTQAVGRLIRTSEDRGIALLLDDRFLRRDHLALFPPEWNNYSVFQADQADRAVEAFWLREETE